MRLGDVLIEFKERPAPASAPPVLTLTERNGFVRQADRFNKRLAVEDTSNYKLVQRGDIAFNPYLLWAGAVAHNTIVDEGVISPLYPTFRVRHSFDSRYVAYLLLTPRMITLYDGIAFGSVPRRRRSSVADFLALEIPPLPPIEEQRRIADILDRIDALRAKRQESLALLDDLTQSIFFDMFGIMAPVTIQPLGKVATFFGGTSLPEGSPFVDQSDGYLLVKVSDMTSEGNETHLVKSKSWMPTPGPPAATCPAGSVVIPKRGAAISTNKKRLTVRPCVLDPNLMGIAPGPRLDSEYLLGWFQGFDIGSITSGSSVPQLNKQDLAPLPIPVPPQEHQQMFALRVRNIRTYRLRQRNHLALLDELFRNAQQRAFAGEL